MSTIGFPTFTLFAKALLPAGFYGDGGMVGSFSGGEMRVRVFILQVIAQANEVSKHRVSRRQALNARSKGVEWGGAFTYRVNGRSGACENSSSVGPVCKSAQGESYETQHTT